MIKEHTRGAAAHRTDPRLLTALEDAYQTICGQLATGGPPNERAWDAVFSGGYAHDASSAGSSSRT